MADKRLRLSFDAETEAIRRAVYIAASMRDKKVNEVLNDLIKTHLARYVAMAEQALAEEEPGSRPPRRKSGSD